MSITVTYKLMLSFFNFVAGYVQSSQNDKCTVSLQYLKKGLSYEADVLHVDQHYSLLQVDSIIFGGFGHTCPNCLGKFAIFFVTS